MFTDLNLTTLKLIDFGSSSQISTQTAEFAGPVKDLQGLGWCLLSLMSNKILVSEEEPAPD